MLIGLKYIERYRVRQRGCSLTHSARTPPAVHPGITIWVDEIKIEKKNKNPLSQKNPPHPKKYPATQNYFWLMQAECVRYGLVSTNQQQPKMTDNFDGVRGGHTNVINP